MVFIVNTEFFNLFLALTDGGKVRAASYINTCCIGIDNFHLYISVLHNFFLEVKKMLSENVSLT